MTQGIWRIFARELESFKNLHFNGLLLTKVYNVWASKVQSSYVWWHSRLIQGLKKNWLVLPKITWGIWNIFPRALESLKIGTWMASFGLNLNIYELKLYRGVMCHGNEKWCKNWSENDLSVQNWHEELDESWPEHSKISKNCTIMDSVWTKYIMFELKNYTGVMFNGTEYWCKIWRKTDLCF